MSGLFWLSQVQFDRIKPYFPVAHGIPRIDDLRVVSGIIHVIRNSLQWRDAPLEYGSYKTLYHRFLRWSRMGVFNHIFAELAADGITVDWLTIQATDFSVQRTAVRLVKKGMFPAVSVAQGRDRLKSENIPKHKHYTTILLEPELQKALKEIAVTEGCSTSVLCAAVYDLKNPTNSFAAALRVFIVEYYRSKAKSVLNGDVLKVLRRVKVKPRRK